jgi:hypothetical protein
MRCGSCSPLRYTLGTAAALRGVRNPTGTLAQSASGEELMLGEDLAWTMTYSSTYRGGRQSPSHPGSSKLSLFCCGLDGVLIRSP